MEFARKALEFRTKNQRCCMWTFFFANCFLLILVFAFLGTGAAVTNMPVFGKQIKWIQTDYVITLVLFTLFYMGMFCLGICIVGKFFGRFQKTNCAILTYASTMGIIGFVAMAAQGGALALMESIDIIELEKTCQADPEEMKDIKENKPLGWLYVPLAQMANTWDDYSESMLDGVMCTATCPCYGDSKGYMGKDDAYAKYAKLQKEQPEYLGLFDRVLNPSDIIRGRNTDLIPFTWSTDRSKSYESFYGCYTDWREKAKKDKSIDLDAIFNTQMFGSETGRRARKGGRRTKAVVEQLNYMIEMEDELECSGMCRPALFYFGRNITESGPPPETCLHEMRKHMMENGVPYTTVCTLLALNSLLLTILAPFLTREEEPEKNVNDFDNVNPNHQPQPVGMESHLGIDIDKNEYIPREAEKEGGVQMQALDTDENAEGAPSDKRQMDSYAQQDKIDF